MIIIDEIIIVLEPLERRTLETVAEGHGFLGIDFSQSRFLRPVLNFFGGLKRGAVSLFGKVFHRKTAPVQSNLNTAADEAHDEMTSVVKKLDDGTISYTRLRADLRDIVDKLHRTAFGIGVAAGQGVGVTSADKVKLSADQLKWLEDEIRAELQHVDKLARDLESARASGGKALRRHAKRLRAYADAAKHVYYAGRIFGAPAGTVVDWISALDRNTCAGCRFMAAYSPYLRETLPTTPRAGQTPCRTNCRCRLVLRQVSPGAFKYVQDRQKERAWYAKMLEGIMAGRILRRGFK